MVRPPENSIISGRTLAKRQKAQRLFAEMKISKDMQNKDLLAIKLRDDLFLKMLSKSKEEIRQIWKS